MPEPVDPALLAELLGLVDLLTPHAIRVAVTLGLPPLIAEGATLSELAERIGADEAALVSLLRYLAGRGLVDFTETGRPELTALGRLLTHPDARAALDLRGAQARMDLAWAGLEHTIRTGGPSYSRVHGQPFWEHLGSDPVLSASFDDYMTRSTTWTAAAARLPVWPDRGVVVDVGGGIGWLLADVLETRPGLRGVLVELADTADRARDHLTGCGLADRVSIHAGSFFDPLPEAADMYVLGHILHDWPDAEAVRILRRVAEAARDDTQVLLVEQVLDPQAPELAHVHGDLLMRVLFGSHERSAPEWAALAGQAGLALAGVQSLDEFRSVVELRPRSGDGRPGWTAAHE